MASLPSMPPRKVADISGNPATGQIVPGAVPGAITRQAVGPNGVQPGDCAGQPVGVTADNLPLSPSQS